METKTVVSYFRENFHGIIFSAFVFEKIFLCFLRETLKNLFKNAWRNNLAKSVENSFWMHFATTTSLYFSKKRIFRIIFVGKLTNIAEDAIDFFY